MNTADAANIHTDRDAFLGIRRTMCVQHSTTYCRGNRDFTFTHPDAFSVVTANNYGHSVMVSMTASGSMFGDPADDDALGLAHTGTHMTADEARALAHRLLTAAAELEG